MASVSVTMVFTVTAGEYQEWLDSLSDYIGRGTSWIESVQGNGSTSITVTGTASDVLRP